MPLLLQHILVLTLTGACLGVVVWQAVRSLVGKRSRLGSCCAQGCPTTHAPKPGTERVVFLPVESLTARRPRRTTPS